MLEPFTLEGTHVRLEPLSESHVPALVEAAAEDRSHYRWSYVPDGTKEVTDYVRDALAKVASGAQVAFATVRRCGDAVSNDRVVGATRFCEVSYWQWPPGAHHQRNGVPDAVDIGSTWLAGSAQRTLVNTEAKLLMMTHAFEVWGVHRVALQTDVRNKRSWAAIERIGGKLDGILRADWPGGRRHGAHLGPLLHRGLRVSRGEGAPDGATGPGLAPGRLRRGQGKPRSSAGAGRVRPPRPRPWA